MTTRDVYESGFDEASGEHIDADAFPECDDEPITDGGENRCIGCGLIVDEYRIDYGPALCRFGDTPDETERTGAPLTPARHDRGLSSEIGDGVDGEGNPLRARSGVGSAELERTTIVSGGLRSQTSDIVGER